MSNIVKGAALFISGAIVGAAAALLLAPKKGEEMRKDLSDLAAEAKKQAQDYYEQVKKDLAEAEAKLEDAAEAKLKERKQNRKRKKEA